MFNPARDNPTGADRAWDLVGRVADGINLTYLGDDWDAPAGGQRQARVRRRRWWSPSLLWAKPDRLTESRGRDVLDSVDWYPVVTFFQATADLFVAGSADMPRGHGHRCCPEYADALAVLWAPQAWSDADTARLKIAVSDLITATGGN